YNESYRRLGIAVDQSGHVIELALPKQQPVAALREKRLEAMKHPGHVRSRLLGGERSNGQAEKTGGRRGPFAQLIPKLMNTGSQQARVNLRVCLIHVPEVSRRDRFLVEGLRRRSSRPFRREKYRLGESRGNQMSQQGGAIPTLERGPAKIQIVDLDA